MPSLLRNNVHCYKCGRTPPGFIHCHRCRVDKRPSEFYPSRKPGFYISGCKDCRRASSRSYGRRTYVPVGAR
jgi:hypothetical protein